MSSRTDSSRRGFTLIEGLVSLLIVTVVIVGFLTLLDSSTRLAKQEIQVSDAQGGGRSATYEVVRIIRQARCGQLAATNALMPWVNNATNETITAGSVTHTLRPGTDSIEVRGAIFGDTYYFEKSDVRCAGGACTAADTATVTIRQLTASGYQNFPAAGRPELASRTKPFYFVVATTRSQVVNGTDAAGTAPYSTPLYYVGRVNANTTGSWYTLDETTTPKTFRFNLELADAGAREMNASSTTTVPLADIFSGGAIDRVVLFVDRGPQDPAAQGGGYTHPFLAQAVASGDGTWEVQRLVDDVEDLQIAYGIDGIVGGSTPDRGVDPSVVSTGANGDEWVYNVAGETLAAQASPKRYEGFLTGPGSIPSNLTAPAGATPALRAVYVGIVTKSLDSDFRFSGPGAAGMRIFDSTALPVSAQPYRRRVQQMAVNLRNYV